ncbi:Rho GTPase-activating protein 39 isoform 2 [Mycena kentingensis (nom. inval.)]|nr:Rho GTPase-activating protein 39 isoform 2 [Mycena kentingensis (nom. inval.)]
MATETLVSIAARHSATSALTSPTPRPSTSAQSTPSTTPSPARRYQKSFSSLSTGKETDDGSVGWGSNFWVTLRDPQTQATFYACPATGQVSWDPPVNHFVLPPRQAILRIADIRIDGLPSADGEWWELSDESRGGLSYYYQTRTGETVWEKPEAAFVIPLGIIQNTALGRRLSQATFTNFTTTAPKPSIDDPRQSYRRSRSFTGPVHSVQGAIRRSSSIDQNHGSLRLQTSNLPTIPGSPDNTDVPSSPSSTSLPPNGRVKEKSSPNGKASRPPGETKDGSPSRTRSKSTPYRPPQPQSLNAAAELLAHSDSGHTSSKDTAESRSITPNGRPKVAIPSGTPRRDNSKVPPSPRRPIPATPTGMNGRSVSAPSIARKGISAPIPNQAATRNMSPVKNRVAGKPILVEPRIKSAPTGLAATLTVGTGAHPILPLDLASDIQQFSESEYARRYFSTHRTGFIFRRRVPVEQMMKHLCTLRYWQLRRPLHKDAVKVFKVVQHIMGDRDRDRPVNVRLNSDNHVSTVAPINASTTSLSANTAAIVEEERWLLGEGLMHGELRDEIYCQTMKQLTVNPSAESIFKGWQLLCVLLITFPPSKNFETYLRSFIQQHTTKSEGRVDVMAKYCLKRLGFISKKGPRGKPPSPSEIETASDAAFNPSTFGESLDAIFRLQERTYPQQKVPIILPFLADGILALGGTKSEGIFRVPGDGDSVSDLKLRIDKGYYTLDGVDDPHVLASLMKLWLRELLDPLVPEEMYNECITNAKEPAACISIVERLPTINRRVVLFVISFLQLFLEDRVQAITKMTPANLALVMAPNLLRCNSDSMSVVFTNAQYEQLFVFNLLLNLNCNTTDDHYKPVHGRGAVLSSPTKSPGRRPGY